MFGTILLTVLVCAIAALAVEMWREWNQAEKKCRELTRENKALADSLARYKTEERRAFGEKCYNKGLADGRATDELYKSLVRKYRADEQVTVMMHGEKEGKTVETGNP